MFSELSDRILWIVGHLLVLRLILDKKRNSSHFLYENFHILCHLLISRLNGDGLIANGTRIQTTGTTSVSTCRPAYCFRRTCGKSVLGTKVLGNAVPERTTNFGWPAVQQVRDLCFYFLSSSSFCSRSSLYSQIMRLDMTYRIGNQSIFSQSVCLVQVRSGQSVSQSVSPVQSSPVQSSPAQPSPAKPNPAPSPASQPRTFGKHGIYHHIS